MKDRTDLKIEVLTQGAPRVNIDGGCVTHRSEDVAIAYIDMASKRCDIGDWFDWDGHDIPQLVIRATMESLYLDESMPIEAYTMIALPEFAGWKVLLADLSRYTLCVCLVKREPNEQ